MKFLRKLILVIFLSKKNFNKPKKKKILIIDKDLSEYIKFYFNKESSILDTRFDYLPKREINMYILLKSFIKFKFSKFQYLCEYIRSVNPKVLVTLIDNNPTFYKFKKYFPNIKTIMIQNALRTRHKLDILGNLKLLDSKYFHVDYYFCFNEKIGLIFKRLLKCIPIPIGSFRSNFYYYKKKLKKKYDFLYISIYRASIDPTKKDLFFFSNLEKYLISSNQKLTILGSQIKDAKEEHEFYKKHFQRIKFVFIKNYKKRRTYEILDRAKITINIDSTAGYESLIRFNKTAFFCLKATKPEFDSLRFGWPNTFKKRGNFWTNKNNYLEVCRVLNYLTKIDDKKFIKFNNKIINTVIKKDTKNKEFKSLINKLI